MADPKISRLLNDHVIAMEKYYTIAVRYPELPAEETLFGSNFIYFIAEVAMDKERERLEALLSSGEYVLADDKSKELYKGIIPSEHQWKLHRYALISATWFEGLRRVNYKPDISMFPDFWYEFNRNGSYYDKDDPSNDFKAYIKLNSMDMGKSRLYWDDKTKKDPSLIINFRHPLNHFPPSRVLCEALKSMFLYHPSDKALVEKFIKNTKKYYGDNADNIVEYVTKANKPLSLNNILTPLGTWGFSVNLEPLGMSTRYSLSLDDFFVHDLKYLRRIALFKNKWIDKEAKLGLKGAEWYIYNVQEEYFLFCQYHYAEKFLMRDALVQYWIKTGFIDPEYKNIVVLKKDKQGELYVSFLRDFTTKMKNSYDFKIKEKEKDVGFMQFISFVGTVIIAAIAAYTGNYAMATSVLVSFVGSMAAPLLLKIFSFLPDDIEGVLNTVVVAMLDSYAKQSITTKKVAYKEMSKALIAFGNSNAQAMGRQIVDEITAGHDLESYIEKLDKGISDKEKEVIMALLRFTDPNAEQKIKDILEGRYEMTPDVNTGEVHIYHVPTKKKLAVKAGLFKSKVETYAGKRAITEEESREIQKYTGTAAGGNNALLLGAAAVGLALLLKKK